MRGFTGSITHLGIVVSTIVATVAGAAIALLRRPAPVLVPVPVDRRRGPR